jgi:hypothetical protein
MKDSNADKRKLNVTIRPKWVVDEKMEIPVEILN